MGTLDLLRAGGVPARAVESGLSLVVQGIRGMAVPSRTNENQPEPARFFEF